MKQEDRLNRVTELTSRLIDDLATPEEQQELNDLLTGDPDACERYLDVTETHAVLTHEHLADDLASAAQAIPDKHDGGRKSRVIPFPRSTRGWASLAAAAAITLLLNAVVIRSLTSQWTAEPTANDEWVAVLSHLVDPVWEVKANRREQGTPLAAGTFKLKSGLAQIEFFSGASVIVEGPAELELISPWLIECRSGRLRTSVPEPAQGFTIETPDYKAVDLGTEFSLSVTPDGQSELHVVEGKVRLDDKAGNELKNLVSGNGIRATGGTFESVTGGGTDFVDRKTLLNLSHVDRVGRYREWLASRDTLLNDPDTLILFDFESQNAWDRQLLSKREDSSNGAIIGAQWARGRWPGKGALNFKRVTDRVRLDIPGSYESLTMSAWIKVESLDRWYSSIILTDGFEKGEPHWQITGEGKLILGIGGTRPPNTESERVIHPGDLGRWIHLAVTIDRPSNTVIHYVDGEIVEKHERTIIPKLRFGGSEIGNWRIPKQIGNPIRSLNGRLDEFVILQRTLTPEEIKAHYLAGKPTG